jgi:conjugative relaxase-like TrwC/TraI family protein
MPSIDTGRTRTPRKQKDLNADLFVAWRKMQTSTGSNFYKSTCPMLTSKAQYHLGNAKEYFESHLRVGDYYTEGQRLTGEWIGKGAERLRLAGVPTSEEFLRMCDNLHPQTGQKLTLRQKTTRLELRPDGAERETANRRVFYDFTFSPPKSVSIAALIQNDTRIVEAHDEAIRSAVQQLESFAGTRVRKAGSCNDRPTQNVAAALFRHETSRAMDPHLHTHCIVFNATYDATESCWKALQNHDMLVASRFVQNVYYHELTRKLRRFGYSITNTPRGDFEIDGVAPELIQKFSKRHRQIDDQTQKLLEAAPDKSESNLAEIRDHIAHKHRTSKSNELSPEELQRHWQSQLTPLESEALTRLTGPGPLEHQAQRGLAEKALIWAEDHLFDRHSVVRETDLWRHALEFARGQDIPVTELQSCSRARNYLRDDRRPGFVTTKAALEREKAIVYIARLGVGASHPLCAHYTLRNQSLDPEQRKAVDRLVHSCNFISLFRGGAGTGKSYALREVHDILRTSGRGVLVLAPQRQQVIDLEKDGFQQVATVSAFLAQSEMKRGTVVIVDEAGQLGGKQMIALIEKIKIGSGRLILSGDTRQHGPVEAMDAMRAIEKYSGLEPIELTAIRRQNPELAKTRKERQRIKQYRRAVREARDGNVIESFQRLDRQGAITESGTEDHGKRLIDCYLNQVDRGDSTVIVSQSWDEIHRINESVRAALKERKKVGEIETPLSTLVPRDATEAQKRDPRTYTEQTRVVFNRNVCGFKKGDQARLVSVTDTHLEVAQGLRTVSIPFKHLERLTLCDQKELNIATGDRLQLKSNGLSADGRRLANGELVTVRRVLKNGSLQLTDGRVLGTSFRQFIRGYAVTSYGAQGKTVDQVIFSDSSVQAATSREQWYVTISRGRKGIHIFTRDKDQLRESIARNSNRPLAMQMKSQSGEQSTQQKLNVSLRTDNQAAARSPRRTDHRRRPPVSVQTSPYPHMA